jgi:signal transduction histidine kinase
MTLVEESRHPGGGGPVYLSIPIHINQRMLGMIEVVHSDSGSVKPSQQSFYSALGKQIGVALQNARLFEQVNQGYERVKALSHRLVALQENERHSIARELHDETSQILASMMVGLDLLQRSAGDSFKTQAGVAELEKIVSDLMENMNRIASNLRPPVLDKLGLTASLREYARAFMERHRIEVNFETFGLPGRLPPEMEIAIFRIVQESLTNVLRHAEASQVDILLKQVDESLILLVEDNGMGFSSDLISRSRLGLVGMRERVEALGGTLVIETAPLEGVLLQAVFPLSNNTEDIT